MEKEKEYIIDRIPRLLKAEEIECYVSETGIIRSKNKKILKKEIMRNGYERVTICNNGKHKHCLVHRLVALAFIPNPNKKPCVNHKDGNKLNNNVNNLEWCTYKENELHSIHVLNKKINYDLLKEMNKKSIKKNSKKVEKRNLKGEILSVYNSLSQASRKNKISEGNISMCCNKKRRMAGGYIWNFVY